MKQLLHLNKFECAHYSVDGIVATRLVNKTVNDVTNEVVKSIENIMNSNNESLVIRTVDLSNMNQWSIEIDHEGFEDFLVVPIQSNYAKTHEDAETLYQFFVEKISTSNEPIIEVGEIIESFSTNKREITQEGNL